MIRHTPRVLSSLPKAAAAERDRGPQFAVQVAGQSSVKRWARSHKRLRGGKGGPRKRISEFLWSQTDWEGKKAAEDREKSRPVGLGTPARVDASIL